MPSHLARKKTPLFITVAVAGLVSASSSAQDGGYVRFQAEIVSVVDGTLVPLPNVAAVMTPPTLVSPGAATQLTSIVNAVLSTRPDGAAFELRYDGQKWKLAARTQPRRAVTSALVAPLFAKFLDCFDSLDPSAASGELRMAASGFAPDDVAKAKEGAAEFLRSLAIGCVPKTQLVTIDQDRASMTLEAMLSGEFNSSKIALSELNDIAAVLNPPILGKTGLYVRERSDQLREILTEALWRGLPTISAFDSTAGVVYETFFDFVKASVLANPGVRTDYLVSIGRACITDVDAFYQPFSLSSCFVSGRFSMLKLWLGGQGYVLAAEVP